MTVPSSKSLVRQVHQPIAGYPYPIEWNKARNVDHPCHITKFKMQQGGPDNHSITAVV